MAHAALGDWSSPCVRSSVGVDNPYALHFKRWAERLYSGTQGRIGFAAGSVLHLWHGEMSDRGYADRNRELVAQGFNPDTDLAIGERGGWEWTGSNPMLEAWAMNYFRHRREDGDSDGIQAA
jgi:hypothetical protein